MKQLFMITLMLIFFLQCQSRSLKADTGKKALPETKIEATSKETLASMPLGSYQYAFLTNGQKIGSAMFRLQKEQGQYISYFELTIQVGPVITITKEFIRESEDFKPLSYTSITTITKENFVQRNKLSATFKGAAITLDNGKQPRTISIKGPFVIGSNYFTAAMKRKHYATGTIIEGNIYDPSIEEDQVIPVKEKVVGPEKVTINGKEFELIHTIQSFGTIKDIHNYVDNNGVLYKSVITMLNSTIEMILEK